MGGGGGGGGGGLSQSKDRRVFSTTQPSSINTSTANFLLLAIKSRDKFNDDTFYRRLSSTLLTGELE